MTRQRRSFDPSFKLEVVKMIKERKRITSTVLSRAAESAMILITPLGSGV